MKKNICLYVLILISLALVGCGGTLVKMSATHDIKLKAVEKPSEKNQRYGPKEIVEDGITKYAFEDDVIRIVIFPREDDFFFNLTNKTDNTLKIRWDEAAFTYGKTQRVIHSGVKLSQKSESQPPTIIPRRGSIDDVIQPTDHIYYISGRYGGWGYKPLIGNNYSESFRYNPDDQEKIEKKNQRIKSFKAEIAKSQNQLNKNMEILLPIQIEEIVNEYIFIFDVSLSDPVISENS